MDELESLDNIERLLSELRGDETPSLESVLLRILRSQIRDMRRAAMREISLFSRNVVDVFSLYERYRSGELSKEYVIDRSIDIDPILACNLFASEMDTGLREGVYIILHTPVIDTPAFTYSLPNFKIGKGDNIERRVPELQTGNPNKLRVLHVIQTDDRSWTEAFIHRSLACNRFNGEWFRLSRKQLAVLVKTKMLNKGKSIDDQVRAIQFKVAMERVADEIRSPLIGL